MICDASMERALGIGGVKRLKNSEFLQLRGLLAGFKQQPPNLPHQISTRPAVAELIPHVVPLPLHLFEEHPYRFIGSRTGVVAAIVTIPAPMAISTSLRRVVS